MTKAEKEKKEMEQKFKEQCIKEEHARRLRQAELFLQECYEDAVKVELYLWGLVAGIKRGLRGASPLEQMEMEVLSTKLPETIQDDE